MTTHKKPVRVRVTCVLTLVLLLCGAGSAAAAPNTLTPEEKAAGFKLIFNGKDLSGWSVPGNNWEVQDGAIARTGKGVGIDYTAEPVPDDFELRFEWKISSGGNSGVYYRPGQYEYQVLDNQRHRDGKDPRTNAASLYYAFAPSKDATKPVGEWNTGRIVARGTKIEHWLNGEKVVDIDYTDPALRELVERLRVRGGDVNARGRYLNLQDHGDPVWYRSLRMRAIR
ncbi:MAG TPA: DUF1080 domain-containing protein [Bryobacterales bacterium]|nr:DUF1080 domain-containing protein [Bryobacterales bacterium]